MSRTSPVRSANLEHEFGVSLFIRSNRGVTLTPEGQKLYTRVAAAHHQLSSAEAELADAKSLTSGTITLGVSEAALQILLLPKLREFHQKFPEIKIHISSVTTPQAVSSLKSGLVDLAIVTSPTGVTRPLKEIPLRPIREVLIGGPRFASLSGTPKTLKELADYPFILLNSQTNAHDFYLHFFSEHGISIKPDIEVVTTDQISSYDKVRPRHRLFAGAVRDGRTHEKGSLPDPHEHAAPAALDLPRQKSLPSPPASPRGNLRRCCGAEKQYAGKTRFIGFACISLFPIFGSNPLPVQIVSVPHLRPICCLHRSL